MGEQRGTIKVTAKIYHLTKAFFKTNQKHNSVSFDV